MYLFPKECRIPKAIPATAIAGGIVPSVSGMRPVVSCCCLGWLALFYFSWSDHYRVMFHLKPESDCQVAACTNPTSLYLCKVNGHFETGDCYLLTCHHRSRRGWSTRMRYTCNNIYSSGTGILPVL